MNRREILTMAGGLSTVVLGGCLVTESPRGTPRNYPTDTPIDTPLRGGGPTRWERSFEDVPTHPAVGPMAYVGVGSTVYGLDPFSGKDVWTRLFDKPPQFLHVSGNTVYVNAYEEGPEVEMDSPASIHAIHAETGESRWTFEFDGRGECVRPCRWAGHPENVRRCWG